MTTKWYFQQILLYSFFATILLTYLVIGNYHVLVTVQKEVSWDFVDYVLNIIVALLLTVACYFFVGCLQILMNCFKKYIKFVISNRRMFYHCRLERTSCNLQKRIVDGNPGLDQAKELLGAVYVISRSSIFGVCQFRLNYCLRVIRNICPNVKAIETRSEFHPEGLVEYLYISYYVLGKPTDTQIRIAEALDYKY